MAQPVKVKEPYLNRLYRKCMDISFQCTEDADFLKSVRPAKIGAGWDNYDGISGMLHKWFEMPGAVIALGGYIAIVSKLNIWILLYLAGGIGIHYAMSLAQKRQEHRKREELAGNERRSNYLYDVMYDFFYGKEIRLYNLSEWLGSRFMLYRDRIRGMKETMHNFVMWSEWVDVFLTFIREGIVYGYLVFLVAGDRMTIADFTMYAAAIAGFRSAFERAFGHLADLHGLSMQMDDYRSFMAWPDNMAQAENPVPIPPGPYEFSAMP